MIVEAGQIALALAFAASIYSALASAAGVARRSSETLIRDGSRSTPSPSCFSRQPPR